MGYDFSEGQVVEAGSMAVRAVNNAGDCDRIQLIFEYYYLGQAPQDQVGSRPATPARVVQCGAVALPAVRGVA